MPGIMAQTMAFSSFIVAIGLTADIDKGIVDRMRSLPITRRPCWSGAASPASSTPASASS